MAVNTGTTREEIESLVRRVRARYDALRPGEAAVIHRAATANELRVEGIFWRLVDDANVPDGARSRIAFVVACFGAAARGSALFPRWLRHTVFERVSSDELPIRAVRFRRLLAARDRDALVHDLRRLLRHGFQKSRRGVEWGALGADVFFWGDSVRRRWAEQFFAGAEPESTPAEEAIDA